MLSAPQTDVLCVGRSFFKRVAQISGNTFCAAQPRSRCDDQNAHQKYCHRYLSYLHHILYNNRGITHDDISAAVVIILLSPYTFMFSAKPSRQRITRKMSASYKRGVVYNFVIINNWTAAAEENDAARGYNL